MPSLEWTVERVRGVALVELVVANDRRRARVRIENLLDGPVWPPRRRGVPEAGWDGDGVTVTLEAGERRAIGYATPAPPAEPPAELAETRPAPAEAGGFEPAAAVPAVDPTPAGVVRTLGDPRPPRDAVPVDAPSVPGPPAAADRPSTGPPGPSGPVDAWLAEVARRVERAEVLAGADTLAAAGDELAAAGGIEGARRLAGELERDAVALRRVADRAADLADRAAAVEVPLEAYRRLAGGDRERP